MVGRLTFAGLILVAVAACSQAGSVITSEPPAASPSPANQAASPSRSRVAPTVTPAAATPSATSSPGSTTRTEPPLASFSPGDIAIVSATTGVRMRTKPSTASGSLRYTPLLPKGTDLYVISGPKHGSGYDWYEVSPITFQVTGLVEWPDTIVGPGSTGWVAVASRDGEPWLAHGSASCPAAPDEALTLAHLTIGARLGCFSGVPITLRARLLPCNCDMEGPSEFRPSWFEGVVQDGEWQGLVIVPPTTRPPLVSWPNDVEMLWLRVDPKASHPQPIPVDKVVTLTGMFDHPSAAACRVREADVSTFKPTDMCRYWFAVTSIR